MAALKSRVLFVRPSVRLGVFAAAAAAVLSPGLGVLKSVEEREK